MVNAQEGFYGVKQSSTVKFIKHHTRDFPRRDDKTKLMYVHQVTFTDGRTGEIFQHGDILTANKKEVKEGDTLDVVFSQTADPEQPDKITIYYDSNKPSTTRKEDSENTSPKPQTVSGTAMTFSTGYAKDMAMAFFKDKPNATENDWIQFVCRVSVELKNNIISNL